MDEAFRDLIEGNWAPAGEARPMIEYRPTRRMIMTGPPARRFLLDHHEEVTHCGVLRVTLNYEQSTPNAPISLVELTVSWAKDSVRIEAWECLLLDYVLEHIEGVHKVDWDSNMFGHEEAVVTMTDRASAPQWLYRGAELVPTEEVE